MSRIYEFLETTAKLYPNKISFRKRVENGTFSGRSFEELKKGVDELIAGLESEGIDPEEKIIFFCDATPNWILVDFAILSAGCVSVPRGTDVTEEDIVYICNHSESRIAIVQAEKDRKRLESISAKIPGIKKIYILENEKGELAPGKDTVHSIMESGKKSIQSNPDKLIKRIQNVNPDKLATLIYTSGTTGAPKGVMLNQSGWISAIQNTTERISLTEQDSCLSLLPPWHAFERAIEYAVLYKGMDMLISDSKTLKEDLGAFKPTLFPSVPRIWESLYNGIINKIKKESGLKQGIFNFSLKVGGIWAKYRSRLFNYHFEIEKSGVVKTLLVHKLGSLCALGVLLPAKALSSVVFLPIHKALGGRLRISVSAGSALPSVVDHFLTAIGLKVLEGYGMTETSAVVSTRLEKAPTSGTVGVPIKGYKIKLINDKGEDVTKIPGSKGTLWIHSSQILQGYYKRPELNETVFDKDGFFNTGDLMSLSWRGELVFAGRSKDTIVLAGGENVEPIPVEDKLLSSVYIDQVMVVGQDQKYLGAVIVPNEEQVKAVIKNAPNDRKLWNENKEIRNLYKNEIIRLISKNTGFKAFELIPGNCFYLMPCPFNPDTEMTRTLKMKRNVISENYSKEIKSMFT